MKKIVKIAFCLFTFVILSCNKSKEFTSEGKFVNEEVYLNQSTEESTNISLRKLIKNGRIGYNVQDLKVSREQIFQATKKYGGYISSDDEYRNAKNLENTIQIRVPSKHFDALMKEVTTGISNFNFKEISIQDVTEEFLDVKARLNSKKELENRYLELLKKAIKVSEILEIEKEINNLRTEIESIEGRFYYLQNQISYSTLTIVLKKYDPNNSGEFNNKFSEGIQNGWKNFVWFFIGLVNIWPFILVFIVLIIFIKTYRKRRKKKK
ncbi:DUF4349 domain-containing protein [Aureivirga marina]|uniref:DUF4349 domain-containing protein n=1 Tax=Aureivirga marina TaxID=1182451 RepID=UPI0018CB49EB|nr:DUF4349 domain-containing protein [Aureivirga marina]